MVLATGADAGITTQSLVQISHLVERASGRRIAANKSIVGSDVFTHESGIHVDGLLKHRRNYEGLNPDELGRSHSLVLGKHSGAHMVRNRYRELGIELDDNLIDNERGVPEWEFPEMWDKFDGSVRDH